MIFDYPKEKVKGISLLDTLRENSYRERAILLSRIRNNVILRTMAIVYPADTPHPRDQKRPDARKREPADGDGDKMKCNGSHSTATDRSFFQRISRAARNFGSRRGWGGKGQLYSANDVSRVTRV